MTAWVLIVVFSLMSPDAAGGVQPGTFVAVTASEAQCRTLGETIASAYPSEAGYPFVAAWRCRPSGEGL